MAHGSALEIQTQLDIAQSLGLGDKPGLTRTKELAEETSRMLWATAHKLKA
jgi:four helix bundle protein